MFDHNSKRINPCGHKFHNHCINVRVFNNVFASVYFYQFNSFQQYLSSDLRFKWSRSGCTPMEAPATLAPCAGSTLPGWDFRVLISLQPFSYHIFQVQCIPFFFTQLLFRRTSSPTWATTRTGGTRMARVTSMEVDPPSWFPDFHQDVYLCLPYFLEMSWWSDLLWCYELSETLDQSVWPAAFPMWS